MAKKDQSSGSADDQQLADAVRKSAQQIWQAGLGAFAKAQDQGGKAFARLVKDGTTLQKKNRKTSNAGVDDKTQTANSIAATLGHQAAGTWDKLEQIFEERVARSLAALGMPTQQQFDQLMAEVAILREELAALNKIRMAKQKTTTRPAKTAASAAASADLSQAVATVKRAAIAAPTSSSRSRRSRTATETTVNQSNRLPTKSPAKSRARGQVQAEVQAKPGKNAAQPSSDGNENGTRRKHKPS